MIKILKIREKKTAVSINADVDGISMNLSASAQPAKAFVSALDALVPVVLDILDLPVEWKEGLRVTGVTITPVGETNAKVTLVARKDMPQGSPFNIAVSYRFMEEPESKDGDESDPSALTLSEKQRKAIDRLILEGEKYIKSLKPLADMFGQLSLPLTGGGAVQEGQLVGEGAEAAPDGVPSNVTSFPAPTEGQAPVKAKRGRKSRTSEPVAAGAVAAG